MPPGPFVSQYPLIPPFIYRLPIPALPSFPTTLHNWQSNVSYKLRLHNVRQLISLPWVSDEFHAAKSQLSSEKVEENTGAAMYFESNLFVLAPNAKKYQGHIQKVIDEYRDGKRRIEPENKRFPSLTELSFRAVWKKMAVKEQEEFSLQPNSIDIVRDLRQFVNQKTTRRIPKKRGSQEEASDNESAPKRKRTS